jgi:hypothetical protein
MRERYALVQESRAFQRWAAVNRRLSSALARRDGDFPLPKPFTGAILASEPPGIRRMSDELSEV